MVLLIRLRITHYPIVKGVRIRICVIVRMQFLTLILVQLFFSVYPVLCSVYIFYYNRRFTIFCCHTGFW